MTSIPSRRIISAGKVLFNLGKNPRTVSAGWAAARATAKTAARLTHVLWLEVTGFFFVAFAVIGGTATYRAWMKYGLQEKGKLVAGSLFTLGFGYFAISSFIEAKRRAKRQ